MTGSRGGGAFWSQSPGHEGDRTAQAANWAERPVHLAGDQEVLTALLASAPFSDLPLHFLLRGRDIIQFFGTSGYTCRERMGHMLRGMPYFIHSQGFRPWWPRAASGSVRQHFAALYNELSPYTTEARHYAAVLDNQDWLRPTGWWVRLMTMLGAGRPALTGLPLAIIADVVRLARNARHKRQTP